VARAQIEFTEYEPLRRIRVRVYHQRTKMQIASLGGDFRLSVQRE
jgi:hypothetical protein